MSETFPVTNRNRARRYHERATYDRASVFAILDAAMLAHVAYMIDGQPFCTPTLFWRVEDTLYWHGSSASRMLKSQTAGVSACVTVTHLDGLVLARSGFNHSANYRSAMCFGTAHIINDQAEKAEALLGVVDRLAPGRAAELRPITAQEAKATTVIGMRIEDASAKVRAKGVADNEADYGFPVWAGVIPFQTVVRQAEPCPRLLPGVVPSESLDLYRPDRHLDEALTEARTRHAAMTDDVK